MILQCFYPRPCAYLDKFILHTFECKILITCLAKWTKISRHIDAKSFNFINQLLLLFLFFFFFFFFQEAENREREKLQEEWRTMQERIKSKIITVDFFFFFDKNLYVSLIELPATLIEEYTKMCGSKTREVCCSVISMHWNRNWI